MMMIWTLWARKIIRTLKSKRVDGHHFENEKLPFTLACNLCENVKRRTAVSADRKLTAKIIGDITQHHIDI